MSDYKGYVRASTQHGAGLILTQAEARKGKARWQKWYGKRRRKK